MKERKWTDIAEYLLLAGSGVGAIAAITTKQILYAAAPLSFYLVLNLANRRRYERLANRNTTVAITKLDQRISDNLDTLQQQTRSLPSFLDLATLRKTVLQDNQVAIAKLQDETTQQFATFEQQSLGTVKQDIQQLQEQYGQISTSITTITERLYHLADTTRVEQLEGTVTQLKTEVLQLQSDLHRLNSDHRLVGARALQDQINHLNRRINQLPQPFDATSLKQDMAALLKVTSDMVSRRELAKVASQIEKLTHQQQAIEQSVTPTRIASTILRKRLDMLTNKLTTQDTDRLDESRLSSAAIENLQRTVSALELKLDQIPTHVKQEVQEAAVSHINNLQQQLNGVQQFAQNLEQQQQALREYVDHLPQLLDFSALQNQLKFLTNRIDRTEHGLTDVQTWVEESIQNRMQEIGQQLQTFQPSGDYGLVLDFKPPQTPEAPPEKDIHASRAVLEDALETAEERLIVVWSRPDRGMIDDLLLQKFKAFLNRNGQLDIGWGHLQNAYENRLSHFIHPRGTEGSEKTTLQQTLNQLAQLKKMYPGQFRFKVLGTDENFLVCDRRFAILGIQPVSASNTTFPEVAVGLRTSDPQVIQQLTDRFDSPLLEACDAIAHFNRAATRYELGDKQGAITDYNRVLQIDPSDDVAYNNRGVARYDLGDKDAALQEFERSLQLNPNNVAAYCNRGAIRSESGDKLGAIEDYCFATQADPNCAIAYFYRGLERSRLGNKLGAIYDYSEVIRLEPNTPTAYLYRGLAQIKLGQKPAAIADLTQAAELFANQGDRTNRQQALDTIARLQKALMADLSKPLVANGY